jgi:3-oxosteroid 1-dehydrogenase
MMSRNEVDIDLIIVGSGAGALISALKLRTAGLRPLVLEKQEKVGGSAGISGGVLWIPNNPAQQRAGVQDSYEEAKLYLETLGKDGGKGATPERREAFLRAGPAMVQSLEEWGVPFTHFATRSDYHDELPGGKPEGRSIETPLFEVRAGLGKWLNRFQGGTAPYPVTGAEVRYVLLAQAHLPGTKMLARMIVRMASQRITRRRYLGMGPGLMARILQAALAAGVEIRPETPISRLIVEDNRVVGVLAKQHGKDVEFRSKYGVLLAAGGFSHNKEMREKFGPNPSTTQWTQSNPGDTGEVMQEAMRIGADIDMVDLAWWTPSSVLPDGRRMHHVPDLPKPGCIVVDQTGHRFVDEAGSYVTFGQAMYRTHKERPAVPSWAIMDHRFHSRYAWAQTLPFQKPRSWITSGYMMKGRSLDELARKCGIDAEGLSNTVRRFNGFVEKGVDEDFQRGTRFYDRYYADPFHRPSPTLGKLENAPYYAVRIYPGDVGTGGGLVTDEHARVLRADGSIIDGLLAAGNITAPVFGAAYPGAGAGIAPSAVFGYVAAETVAEQARISIRAQEA